MMVWSLIFSYMAWTLLCAAMNRPYNELFAHARFKPKPLWLRIGGWLLLCVSLGLSLCNWGGSVGFSVWWILLAVSAFFFIIARTYRPKHILWIAAAASVLGVLYSVVEMILRRDL